MRKCDQQLADIPVPERYRLRKGGQCFFIDADKSDLRCWFNEPQVAQNFELHVHQTKVQWFSHPESSQQKVMQLSIASLSQAGMVMRTSGRRPIPAKHPKAAVTLAAPSVFEWEAIGAGVEYEFVLKDEKGNTLFSRLVPEDKVSLPGNIVLDAGAAYRWSVSARGADGSRFLSVYTFRVADPDTRAGFDNFYPRETATLAERVAFAAWLERNGLSEEATRYWDELSKRYGIHEPSRISEN